MLVELCAGNYATHDGLVNGADELFKGNYNIKTISKILGFNKTEST